MAGQARKHGRAAGSLSLGAAMIGAALLAALAWPGPLSADATAPAPGVITVRGEGQATATPDMVTLRISVNHAGETASAALQGASERMGRVLGAIADAGVEGRDVQTSGVSLYPRWADRPTGGTQSRAIVGYEAQNALSLRLRDLSRLGALLDLLVAEGADGLGGLVFGVADPDALQDAARRSAVQDALRKAALYAEAAGLGTGAVLRIDEAGTQAPAMPLLRGEAAYAPMDVPIAEGEVVFTAAVVLVIELTD